VSWIDSEKIDASGYLGIFLVVSGVALVVFNQSKKKDPKNPPLLRID